MTADITITLGSDSTNGPYYAGFLAAEPGAPHSIAVASYSNALLSALASQGVTVYDDTVARPMMFGAKGHGQQANSLAWGASSATLYAYEPYMYDLFTVAISPAGLAQSVHTPLIRWGSDGLAVNAQEGLKILSGALVTL